MLIIRNWNPQKFKPVGSFAPWKDSVDPTGYWDPSTSPVVSSVASWDSNTAPTAYLYFGNLGPGILNSFIMFSKTIIRSLSFEGC